MPRNLLPCLSLVLLLALTGCQSLMEADPAEGLTGVPAVQAHQAAGNLEEATDLFLQLPPLAAGAADDGREAVRESLTDAWKRRGSQALKHHDLVTASAALSRVRALHPHSGISLDALKGLKKGN